MSPEKRKCERSGILLTVEFKEPGGKTGHSLGITRNFSAEGLSFDSQNYNLGPGEVLECTLKHPDSDWSATLRGEIIWKKESWYKCMTGLKFIDLDEEYKSKILEFISLNKKAPEPSPHKKFPVRGSISREAEPVIAAAGKDSAIPPEEIAEKPKAEETPSDDVKTVIPGHKQRRKAADRRVRNGSPAPAPRKNLIMNVLLVIAGFAVISAGILFFMFETSKKDAGIIIPHAPDSANTSPMTNAGNPAADDLSAVPPVPEQTPAAPVEDTVSENNAIPPEPPAAKPDEKSVATQQPVHEPVVQSGGDGTEQPTPEGGRISSPDTGARHTENTVRINAHAPLPDVKKPEKAVKETRPDIKKGTESVTETKDQTSKGSAVIQGSMQEHPAEDKMPAPSKEEIMVYEDSFNDNANDWDIFNTSMASARIEPGEYHIQNKRKTGAHIILHHADFPFDSDFTLEVSMRLVKSSGYYSYGIVLGARDAFNNYTFQISSADSFSIREYHKGIAREIKRGKIVSPSITQNSLNILKVVKQGDAVRFYINDIFVNEIQDMSFPGKKVGFLVDGESEVAVDRTWTRIVE